MNKSKNTKKIIIISLLLLVIVTFVCIYLYYLKSLISFKGIVVELDKDTGSIAVFQEDESRENYNIYYSSISSSSAKTIRVGDLVKITYNGVIMESYPAQINIKDIEVIKADINVTNKLIAFEEAIKDIVSRNYASVKSPKFINIDIGSIKDTLTLEEKAYILNLGYNYKDKVKGLDTSIGLTDSTDLTGTFITFNNIKQVSKDAFIITTSKMVSKEKYVMVKLDIKFDNKNTVTDTLEYLEK